MQDIIKQNINRLDFDLKELFDSVTIVENNSNKGFYFNNKGFYFNIIAEKTIDGKTYKVIAEARKSDFQNNVIHWSYKTNPNDSNSSVIDRSSMLENVAIDMEYLVIKKCFKKDYLESINEKLESVNESKIEDEVTTDILININNILLYHDVVSFSTLKKEYSYNENIDIFIKTPYKIKFELKDQLKESQKIKLEHDILKLEYVDYVVFRLDNTVEISVTE